MERAVFATLLVVRGAFVTVAGGDVPAARLVPRRPLEVRVVVPSPPFAAGGARPCATRTFEIRILSRSDGARRADRRPALVVVELDRSRPGRAQRREWVAGIVR